MATVKIDVIEGSSLTEEDQQITEVTRVAFVSGLTSTNIIAEALSHAEIPNFGASYFGDSNVTLEARRWTGISNDSGKVELIYRRRTGGVQDEPADTLNVAVTGGTATVQITTHRDREGNAIKIFPPVSRDASLNKPSDNVAIAANGVVGSVTVEEAQDIFNWSKRISTNDPLDISRRYKNKINSGSFRGDAAGEWRVVGINYQLSSIVQGSQSYDFTFSFQHNRNGWQPVDVYRDPETKEPDVRIDFSKSNGIGYKIVDHYEQADLNSIFNL